MDSLSYSFRRRLLDCSLKKHQGEFRELILEIGNGTKDQRGRFKRHVEKWFYVEPSSAKRPNVVGNGEQLPLRNNSVMTVLALEVLEHVMNPNLFIKESFRVLAPSGRFYLSTPFLFRFHPAPVDYQRFTAPKLMNLLGESGFIVESIEEHGFYFTVLADLLKSLFARIQPGILRRGLGLLVVPILGLVVLLDKLPAVKKSAFCRSYTTGFFIVAKKSR